MKLDINVIALCLAAVGTVSAAPVEKDRNDPVYRAELEKECGALGVMDVPPGYKESEVRHCREHPLSLSKRDACDGPEKDRNDPVYRAELEKECGDLGVMEVPPGYKECEVRHCANHPNGHTTPDTCDGPEKDRNDPVYRAELEKECGDLGVMEVPLGYKECEVRHCANHPNGHTRPDVRREVEKDRNDPAYRAELEKECGPLGVMEVPAGYKESEVRHCADHPMSLVYPGHEHGPSSTPPKI